MKALPAYLLLVLAAQAERFPFHLPREAEVAAEIEMSSAGSDWAVPGREAAVATVRVDDGPEHHIILYAGPLRYRYRVLLGPVSTGQHELQVERNTQFSAADSGFAVFSAQFTSIFSNTPEHSAYALMPILYARKNSVGKFTDVPLLAYCERLKEGTRELLQYTVIFSNEDGGTSTRALMARWGRTTDIEYVMRVFLKPDGSVDEATVQGPGHQDIRYTGLYEGTHPVLMPVTDNNMVGPATEGPLRFQLAPLIVNLSKSSRETVMDAEPVTYQVMGKELQREGKLRPFGKVAGENISDLRNYLFIDYGAAHNNSALSIGVILKDGRVFSSDLGRYDYAIGRDGWVRTTVELPPGTKKSDIGGIEFRCSVAAPSGGRSLPSRGGACSLQGMQKAFWLRPDYTPGPSEFSMDQEVVIPTGQSFLFRP